MADHKQEIETQERRVLDAALKLARAKHLGPKTDRYFGIYLEEPGDLLRRYSRGRDRCA